MENENTLNFDELPHEDEWADATTREPDMEPDESGKQFLAELEKGLLALSETPEVQLFIKSLRGEAG